ncbi:MAG: tripartite tricarboxylate transporter substrate binding protein [Pseudomonadota bacterium]
MSKHPGGRRGLFLIFCALMALASSPTLAQEKYPSRAITWVVGYPPGGSVDVVTRLVARKLEATLGQPIVVDNKPGATGSLALRYVATQPADGYTLVTVPGPVLTSIPMPQIGKEMSAIAMLAKGSTVLVGPARPDAPKDLKALLADASAHPDKYSYGSSGNGTGQHLTGELIQALTGVTMTHVPYKGGNQAVTDVIGGQIPLAVLGITPVLPHIRSGKLKAYGVSTATRSASLPEVPTLREAGIANFEASQWFVLAARTGLPAERSDRLNEAVAQALKDPEVMKGFENVGMFPEAQSAKQTADYISTDMRRWADLVKKNKIAID